MSDWIRDVIFGPSTPHDEPEAGGVPGVAVAPGQDAEGDGARTSAVPFGDALRASVDSRRAAMEAAGQRLAEPSRSAEPPAPEEPPPGPDINEVLRSSYRPTSAPPAGIFRDTSGEWAVAEQRNRDSRTLRDPLAWAQLTEREQDRILADRGLRRPEPQERISHRWGTPEFIATHDG